jgi:hypothetical protein
MESQIAGKDLTKDRLKRGGCFIERDWSPVAGFAKDGMVKGLIDSREMHESLELIVFQWSIWEQMDCSINDILDYVIGEKYSWWGFLLLLKKKQTSANSNLAFSSAVSTVLAIRFRILLVRLFTGPEEAKREDGSVPRIDSNLKSRGEDRKSQDNCVSRGVNAEAARRDAYWTGASSSAESIASEVLPLAAAGLAEVICFKEFLFSASWFRK